MKVVPVGSDIARGFRKAIPHALVPTLFTPKCGIMYQPDASWGEHFSHEPGHFTHEPGHILTNNGIVHVNTLEL